MNSWRIIFAASRDTWAMLCAALLIAGTLGYHDVHVSIGAALLCLSGLAGSYISEEMP